MNKEFLTPDFEVVRLEVADVITTSGETQLLQENETDVFVFVKK